MAPRILPTIQNWSVGSKKATWSGDAESYFTFEIMGTTVIVDHISRGPKRTPGSAGQMIADALQVFGLRPTRLRAPNVLQKNANSTRLLTEVLITAARLLGARVTATRSGKDIGKVWIEIDLRY